MKYATYDNLKKAGNILIEIEDEVVQRIEKPIWQPGQGCVRWNGDVIVLDYDATDESDDAYTEITLSDKTKKYCHYTVW